MNKPHVSPRSIRGTLVSLAVAFCAATTAQAVMQVNDGKLYDSNGQQFVIRGTNAMTLYWDGYSSSPTGDWSTAGQYTFSQMTQTGANTARIFWNHTEGSQGWRIPAAALDATIQNCIDNNLVPIPELHNVTGPGSLADFQTCIDYWTSPDIAAVFQKYENNIMLNIANEWNVPASSGSGEATDQDIRNAYGPAITAIRNAGINCPLVIDSGRDYAADENAILNNAAYLLNLDPKHNLVFSIHIYDPSSTDSSNRGSQARIKNVMDSMIANHICFIWGEFSRYGYNNGAVEWQYLISYAQQTGTGYLVWAWWDPTDTFSLAYNKMFRAWDNDNSWSRGVTLDDSNGIQQTSLKTLSLPQLDAGLSGSNVSVPSNPVTIAFAGRSTVLTVDSSVDVNRQGAQILQKAYTGAASQKWNLIADGNGYYAIQSVASGKVIEIAGGSTAVLANVQQGNDYGRNFQRWSITDAGSGLVHLQVRHTGQAPVTENDTTDDGAPIETYTYGGNSFVITSVGGSTSSKVECENASLTACSTATGLAGYSGAGYVDGSTFSASNSQISATINVSAAGTHTLHIRYSGEYGDKYQDVYVNGNYVGNIDFPASSGWADINIPNVSFSSGSNTVQIVKAWGWTDFDYIEVLN